MWQKVELVERVGVWVRMPAVSKLKGEKNVLSEEEAQETGR